MANTIVQVNHDLEGISSPTLYLFSPGGTAVAANTGGDALSQAAERKASWRATVAESLSGIYAYEVRTGSTLVAWGFVNLLDDTATYYGVNTYAEAVIGSNGSGLTEAGGTGDHLTAAGGDGSHLTEAGGNGDHLTAIPWNSAWDAEVESEVDDAIAAAGLDHLVSAAVTGADVTDNSIIAKLVSKSATADWDNFDNTTDSLQATRDHIGDGTNLTEAGGDGDHLTEAGGTGDHLTAIPSPYDAVVDVHHDYENDECHIWVQVQRGKQRVDINALDSSASVTVDVREFSSGTLLFTETGSISAASTNYEFELAKTTPGFPATGSKSYIITAEVTISGVTVNDAALVFDALGEPSS